MSDEQKKIPKAKFTVGDSVMVKCTEAGQPPSYAATVHRVEYNLRSGQFDYVVTETGRDSTDGYTEDWLSPFPMPQSDEQNITEDMVEAIKQQVRIVLSYYSITLPMCERFARWHLETVQKQINALEQFHGSQMQQLKLQHQEEVQRLEKLRFGADAVLMLLIVNLQEQLATAKEENLRLQAAIEVKNKALLTASHYLCELLVNGHYPKNLTSQMIDDARMACGNAFSTTAGTDLINKTT